MHIGEGLNEKRLTNHASIYHTRAPGQEIVNKGVFLRPSHENMCCKLAFYMGRVQKIAQ